MTYYKIYLASKWIEPHIRNGIITIYYTKMQIDKDTPDLINFYHGGELISIMSINKNDTFNMVVQ